MQAFQQAFPDAVGSTAVEGNVLKSIWKLTIIIGESHIPGDRKVRIPGFVPGLSWREYPEFQTIIQMTDVVTAKRIIEVLTAYEEYFIRLFWENVH